MNSPELAFRRLLEAIESLDIPFFVCGSAASSAHGVVRATLDVDLVAAVELRHIDGLVAALDKEFYIDADMIRQALAAGRSFNLIHYATAYKFDIFPLGSGSFDASQFQRRTPAAVSLGGAEYIDVPVASAEDTLLSKLVWFRAGGEVSDRQCHDIRGIVEIKRAQLDLAYLRLWAAHLKVEDLLDRVLAQGGA
jgi:D-alanine-D-alanine ligase-like ATP-grasp enzyme